MTGKGLQLPLQDLDQFARCVEYVEPLHRYGRSTLR